MKKQENLRIPGPTPLPEYVLKALSAQMINHRSKRYEEIHKRIVENLKIFFQTKNDIFLLTGSGMGGLEAGVVNFFSPADEVVFFTCGEFGNRWAEIAKRYGASVYHVKIPAGKAFDRIELEKFFNSKKSVKGVFITLNETSSGVINNLKDLVPLIHSQKSEPLLLVDGISALGAVDLPTDELGIDVLITASQKAWMAPPGIAMISVSEKAWKYHTTSTFPKYYFDLSLYREFAQKNQTPATCALTTIYGLDEGLKLMVKEGKEKIFKRHLQIKEYTREKIKKIALTLFTTDDNASPTVTSITIPEGVDGHIWLSEMREKHNVVLAGGMGETKGKIIRIAHMGYVRKNDIDEAINALKNTVGNIKN